MLVGRKSILSRYIVVEVRLRRCCARHDPVDENHDVSVIDSGCLVAELGSVGRCFVDDC